MQYLNTQMWAYHTVATVTPPRPSHLPLQHHTPDPRRTRATSWWGMTLLVARCPFRKSCASTFWRQQRIELGCRHIMFGDFSLVLRSLTMPVPLAPHVTLGGDEQSHLASLVRAHSTPQALVFRCQLILRTAAPDHPSNLQVAQELHCNRHTVGRWRSRYLAQGLRGLQDAPRPGRPRRFSPLSASGCDGDGNPYTCPVSLRRHALES